MSAVRLHARECRRGGVQGPLEAFALLGGVPGRSEVGDWVELDFDEMGASGDYQLMSIDSVPAVRPGVGRPVTGLFEFSHGLLYELRISGQEKPIGLTENHPIWSVDRADWSAAKALRLGERVQIAGGTAKVVSFQESGVEPVYNIEVEGDHCYRVGELGILVHNLSNQCHIFSPQYFGVGGTYDTPGGRSIMSVQAGVPRDLRPVSV